MKHPIDRPEDLNGVVFNAAGLVPVIAQDHATGAVLMLAWATREALAQSLATKHMTYWSRSRKELWEKGLTSGNTQELVRLAVDCDGDAVLALVKQKGPACHEGTDSCWSATNETTTATILGTLDAMAAARLQQPQGRYTDQLLANPTLAASKVIEEANEVGAVVRGEDNDDPLAHEAADLLYHLIVAIRAGNGTLAEALRELASRHD